MKKKYNPFLKILLGIIISFMIIILGGFSYNYILETESENPESELFAFHEVEGNHSKITIVNGIAYNKKDMSLFTGYRFSGDRKLSIDLAERFEDDFSLDSLYYDISRVDQTYTTRYSFSIFDEKMRNTESDYRYELADWVRVKVKGYEELSDFQTYKRESYLNGKLNGYSYEWILYTGFLSRVNYKNGEKEGLEELWDENQQIRSRVNYKNGKFHGSSEKWFRNGQLKSFVNYNNGLKEGAYQTWDENGVSKSKGIL